MKLLPRFWNLPKLLPRFLNEPKLLPRLPFQLLPRPRPFLTRITPFFPALSPAWLMYFGADPFAGAAKAPIGPERMRAALSESTTALRVVPIIAVSHNCVPRVLRAEGVAYQRTSLCFVSRQNKSAVPSICNSLYPFRFRAGGRYTCAVPFLTGGRPRPSAGQIWRRGPDI